MKGSQKTLLIVIFTLLLYGCAGAGDYIINLPNGYILSRTSAHMVSICKKEGYGDPAISPKVTELAWNDKYILTKQLGLKPWKPEDTNNRIEIPDETKVSYWIIQLKDDSIYGPLTDSEFAQKKKDLSIPTDLILKSVSSYKHITDY